MVYEDFVNVLAAANISGREFAKLLRLNVNTISGYKRRGNVPSHLAVIAVLLRNLEEHGIPYKAQLEAMEIEPNAPRGRSISKV